jgi:Heterokaryon incompatibility protein Het-C.
MRHMVIAVALFIAAVATAPEPPPQTTPPVLAKKMNVICVDCGGAFTLLKHGNLLQGLVVNEKLADAPMREMRDAMYWQDSIHQFESKAHFDNCAFEDSERYIGELLAEIDRRVATAQQLRAQDRTEAAANEAALAFFALGQALHAVQDFYAHSNYVEILRDDGVRYEDCPIIAVWTAAGAAKIAQLRQTRNLHSGYVVWGVEKKCPDATEDHHDLNKDSDRSVRGRQHVKAWENRTLHTVAADLALDASVAFLKHAYTRWPYLKTAGGNKVVFDVFQDRRKL